MDLQPWFEAEDFRSHPAYCGMSAVQQGWVDQYRTDGYLILEDTGLESTLLTEVVAQLAGKYAQPATGYSTPGRLQDAWQTTPAVGRIAAHAQFLAVLETLYQKTPVPFQTLNFERGTQQRPHSDTIHFNTLPHGFMCGVWVALEDIDADNGPVAYYPGSQRLPVLHMDDIGLKPDASEYPKYENHIERTLAANGMRPKQALLKRGQALIWSANIIHGGAKVLDPARSRLSQVTHYYFPGCIYYTPLLSSPREQRWMLRQVCDIRTQQLVPVYEGLPEQKPKKARRRWIAKIPLLGALTGK